MLYSASVMEEDHQQRSQSDGLTTEMQQETFFLSTDDFAVNGTACIILYVKEIIIN